MAFNDSDDMLAQKAEQRMAQALATSQVEQDDYLDSQPADALTRGDINRMARVRCCCRRRSTMNVCRPAAGCIS